MIDSKILSTSTKIIENKIFVNGQFISSTSKETFSVVNPATEQIIGNIPLGNIQDFESAINAAKVAFNSWSELTIAERSEYLLNMAHAIGNNRDLLALVESENVGKPINQALADVDVLIDNLKYFAGAARGLTNIASDEYAKGYMSYIKREPLGVIGAITPWNYPLMMSGWKIGPALVMGNTVVLKPSEFTPFSTLLLGEIIKDILPPGVLNIVTAKGETTGDAFLNSPDIHMISLTGSIKSGQYLVEKSADSLKKIHLELGGKAPSIIFEDANLEEVVEGISFAAFYNSGQDCTALTRVYVAKSRMSEFIDLFKEKISQMVVGNPANPETDMGPLVSKQHFERVTQLVERAKGSGIEVITDTNLIKEDSGYYYPPTILVGMDNSAEVIQQEIFGPVVTVMPFETGEEAYQLANDSKYALSASVWTNDLSRSINATNKLDAGTVWVNSHLMFVSEMPHSGGKMSGHGKDQSLYAFDEYSKVKHVMLKI